jgi:ERCC4-type nuclease
MAPKKAVCAANQAALDRLIVRRAAVTATTDHIASMIWERAISSLAAAPHEISTHAQALALPYIGHTMANHLLGRRPTPNEQAELPSKKKAKTKAAAAATCDDVRAPSSPSTVASLSSRGGPKPATAAAVTSREPVAVGARKKAPTAKRPRGEASSSTDKEAAYEKAVYAAEHWKQLTSNAHDERRHLTWRVVLLIDSRERKSEHVQAKCQMSGIPCEERTLPIGDMAWIAQGLVDPDNSTATLSTSSLAKKVVVELMLGTIIERKTPDDLKGSIFGTRYVEQRLRLRNCGLPQLIYLIEGDMNKPLFSCSFDTMHTAVWETRLHLGFAILNTAHMADTVTTLKRMHRRILQRTFPRAFSRHSQALPIYSESSMSLEERRRSKEDDDRRRRRRRQSLAEMTFDMDPTPPLDMKRFMTYQELKAKVELDRQAGTRTVGNIHLAMLKQVPSLDIKKCHAVAHHYPTIRPLLQAFAAAPTQTQTILSLMATQDAALSKKAMTTRTIGIKSAEQLRMAYGKHGSGENNLDDSEPAGSAKDTMPSTATASAVLRPSSTNVAPKAAQQSQASMDRFIEKPAAAVGKRTASRDATDDFTFDNDDHTVSSNAVEAQSALLEYYSSQEKATRRKSSWWDDLDVSPAAAPRPKKRALNTSIGSFLRSSDDDESPLFLRADPKQQASISATGKVTTSTLAKPKAQQASDTVYLDCSSDSDNNVSSTHALRASNTTAMKKPCPQDVIEID